jgi:outer membrane protein assembly factor BamA
MKFFFYAAAIAIAASIFCYLPANAGGPPIITRIVIKGNHRVSEAAIRERISTQPGRPLDMPTVDRDIKTIYHMGSLNG